MSTNDSYLTTRLRNFSNRNGGQLCPPIYNEHARLKKRHGTVDTLQILQFRSAHISSLVAVAKEEKLLVESQARLVDAFDVFLNNGLFQKEKEKLSTFSLDVPVEMAEQFAVIEDREAIEVIGQ